MMTMTPSPTTNDIVLVLSRIGRELDAKQTEIASLDERAVRARADYEVTFSQAFLKADGAVDTRKHEAVLKAAEKKLAVELLDQQLRAARESIRVL